MQIDLNTPDGLTLEAVRQLLASASDDEHTQLRVTKGGIAYISSGVVGGTDIERAAVSSGDVGQGFRLCRIGRGQ